MTDLEILLAGRDLVYYAGCILLTTQGYLLLKGSSDFDNLFKARKLCVKIKDKVYYPKIVSKRKTTYGYSLKLKLPVGLTSEDIRKSQLAIEEMLKAKVDISYSDGYVFIGVYTKELDEEYEYKKIDLQGLKIPIGYTHKGLKVVNLAKGEPHILVAGETGSGKSTLLRSIITNLIINNSDIVLHLIDLKKGVEFGLFKDCKMVQTFSKDLDESYETLNMIRDEVNRRYELFYESECKDFAQYIKKGHKLKRWVLIVDEFSIIAKNKGSVEIFEELSAIARACGIHLILCTQRPDAKVVTGLLKQNIPLVVGLKCLNGTNSRIIIDENGLEKLRGAGHGMIKSGGELVEFQSMFLDEDEAYQLIKSYKVKKKAPKKIIQKDIFEVLFDEAN